MSSNPTGIDAICTNGTGWVFDFVYGWVCCSECNDDGMKPRPGTSSCVELTLWRVPLKMYKGRYVLASGVASGRPLEELFPEQIYFVTAPNGRILEVAGELTARMKECGFYE